ncbi:GyrI-like domain-containing protein [Ensifer oleiphilus]|uniref:GyrI-like domain-containing protein n=1 Tax=Ensifer oleiphilus TaxID=2742698 RepID=UPI0031B82BF0
MFEIVERPAQRIAGSFWEGTFVEAADGAVRRLIAEMQEHHLRLHPKDHPMLVGLSWNDRPDGFRYLVGFVSKTAETTRHPGHVDLPAMRFVSAMHHPETGDVIAHYQHMFDWIASEGLVVDTSRLHFREEYEPGFVSLSLSSLRLMVPVTAPRVTDDAQSAP